MPAEYRGEKTMASGSRLASLWQETDKGGLCSCATARSVLRSVPTVHASNMGHDNVGRRIHIQTVKRTGAHVGAELDHDLLFDLLLLAARHGAVGLHDATATCHDEMSERGGRNDR